jgi:hypothetical protein
LLLAEIGEAFPGILAYEPRPAHWMDGRSAALKNVLDVGRLIPMINPLH